MAIFGLVFPSKGIDENRFSVDSLVEDVKWLGNSKLTLKSDNAPAIVKLLSEAIGSFSIPGVLRCLKRTPQSMIPKRAGQQKSV